MRSIPFVDEIALWLKTPAAGYVVLALVCQVAFWYVGSPGPRLLGAPRDLSSAITTVAWGVVLLGLVPLLALRLRRDRLAGLGFGLGDWRVAAPATALLITVALAGMWVASRDFALQATYPLPGTWPGLSAGTFLAWAGLYALYYLAYESFYRGFLLRTVERAWGLGPAVWFQTAASTMIHLGTPASETLAAIPFALITAALAVRGRSLLWPFLLHLAIGLGTDAFALAHQGALWP
jgi:uncharacterized protein